VTYTDSLTPLVTSIEPSSGTAGGGTEITITGTGFSTTIEENRVTLDGIECVISAATATEITCTTGARPEFVPPLSIVTVNGSKAVIADELTFTYIDNWSSSNTWGGERPP